ncbi:unnamed protein product [Rotaria sp. Silwood1]|nr:unnamed protein product [Rotaria sp. Silwood1]
MQIHILLCATAILTVTQSTPIVITRNDVKDEGITSQTNVTHVQNRAYFVAVKVPRSKRQWGPGVHPRDVPLNRPIVGPTIPLDERTSIFTGAYVDSQGNIDGGRIGFTRTFDSGGCLYGDDFVLLQDGSRKQLRNLRSGDKVYSVDKQGKLVKDEIIMMLHGGPKVEAPFYTLTTSSNRTISLTGYHLIMKYSPQEKRSQMVAANELKTGDYLLMSDKQQTEPVSIISIELLYKTGIYTPMTYTGTLLINDIVVSCYVKYFNKYNELHTLLYPFRFYYYLMKDILGLSEEPFSTVPSVVYGDEQFYGTGMIGWLHQSKNMVRFVGQDLLIGTILSI